MVTNEMKMNELEMAAGGGAMGGQYLGRMGDDEGAGTRSRTSEYVNKGACGGAALGAMVGGGIGGLVAGPAAVPFAGVVGAGVGAGVGAAVGAATSVIK